MKAIVVANGDLPDLTTYRALLAEADLIVAADGGARALLSGGVDPTVLVGDLDSLPSEFQRRWREGGGETLLFPVDKDATDLELAIETAHQRGARRIAVLGAFGGRPDHATANLLLLAAPALAGLDVALLDEGARVVVVRDDTTLAGQPGDLLSLLPLTSRAEGIGAEGLRYPLSGETLTLGSTRGVSNVFVEARARVYLRAGLLLAMHTWSGQRPAHW